MPMNRRCLMDATNATIDKPTSKMFHAGTKGKSIFQRESLPPLGLGSYFMSVITEWPPKNGTTQNADSNNAVEIVVMP